MRGLPSILSLFRKEFNKFNNTGALILDSIYHMILKKLTNFIFRVKTSISSPLLCNVIMEVIKFPDFIAWRYITLRRDSGDKRNIHVFNGIKKKEIIFLFFNGNICYGTCTKRHCLISHG